MEAKPKRRAAAVCLQDIDPDLVAVSDFLDDGQTKTCAALCRGPPPEGLKDKVSVLGRDTRPMIADENLAIGLQHH